MWAVYFWLFFGGADKEIECFKTEEEAKKRCAELEASNGDSTYSGFYILKLK